MTVAKIRPIFAIISLALTLSACVVTPRVEMTRPIDFNYIHTPPVQLSYVDVMCCANCAA